MNKIFKRRDYSSREAMIDAVGCYIINAKGYKNTPLIDFNTDFLIIIRKSENNEDMES